MLRKLAKVGQGLKDKLQQAVRPTSVAEPVKRPTPLVAEPWQIEEVNFSDDGTTSVRGWALSDPNISQASQSNMFTVNGK